MSSAPDPAASDRDPGKCTDCGQFIGAGEGWWQVNNERGAHHADCLTAAYNRGRDDGYHDTVRQIKAATHALKRRQRNE